MPLDIDAQIAIVVGKGGCSPMPVLVIAAGKSILPIMCVEAIAAMIFAITPIGPLGTTQDGAGARQ